MAGARTTRRFSTLSLIHTAVATLATLLLSTPAVAVVVVFDGFGDADRDNDGSIAFYDTDINDSGTFNDPVVDAALAARGITEVTAAEDPNDVGIIWSGIRSYDTTANIPKSYLRIINDNVPTGSETASEIHNSGLALGVESRGGGSSMIGRFPQSIELGSNPGDKLVVSLDFRIWREANNPFTPDAFNELRWGLFEDTDNELGSLSNVGMNGAAVVWGEDDGNWFASQPGAEGDKGIYARVSFGGFASPNDARINWEYNLAGINGTTNNGRIFEGSGVSDTPGAGGDTGTIALPPNDGAGGILSTLATYEPHKLGLELIRTADGLIEVASFINDVEILRDDIKTTDTGFNILGPPAFSYDYIAFRNATGDFDYVIDNLLIEAFESDSGLDGDFNSDGTVDAADYVVWRKTDGTQAGFDLWAGNFGASAGAGSAASDAAGAVPEPASLALLLAAAMLVIGSRGGNRD